MTKYLALSLTLKVKLLFLSVPWCLQPSDEIDDNCPAPATHLLWGAKSSVDPTEGRDQLKAFLKHGKLGIAVPCREQTVPPGEERFVKAICCLQCPEIPRTQGVKLIFVEGNADAQDKLNKSPH